MSLSPEQRDDLQRLLEDELRAAWRTAVASGVPPEEIADLVAERRLAVESALGTGDDPTPGPGHGERH